MCFCIDPPPPHPSDRIHLKDLYNKVPYHFDQNTYPTMLSRLNRTELYRISIKSVEDQLKDKLYSVCNMIYRQVRDAAKRRETEVDLVLDLSVDNTDVAELEAWLAKIIPQQIKWEASLANSQDYTTLLNYNFHELLQRELHACFIRHAYSANDVQVVISKTTNSSGKSETSVRINWEIRM